MLSRTESPPRLCKSPNRFSGGPTFDGSRSVKHGKRGQKHKETSQKSGSVAQKGEFQLPTRNLSQRPARPAAADAAADADSLKGCGAGRASGETPGVPVGSEKPYTNRCKSCKGPTALDIGIHPTKCLVSCLCRKTIPSETVHG